MEAATAPEAALRPTLKVKEASPADADGPQASPQRGTGSPLPQLLPPIEEHPKIWLPRALRQTYIRKVGDTVNLLIPFQGKPKPQAIWTRDGCALDTSRVSVRNGDRDSILFIREAQRADSGRYQLSVQLGGLEATATIDILVIERLGPPQSIKLVDVWGSSATLEWTPPQDMGNAALLGYTVQKADTKSGGSHSRRVAGHLQLCFTVLERCRRASCTIPNLVVGNSYAFRVFAENKCGLSENAPVTADLAHIQKAGPRALPSEISLKPRSSPSPWQTALQSSATTPSSSAVSVPPPRCHLMLLLLVLSRFSRVQLCATPWTAAYQAPPSMGFSSRRSSG
ncbi:myosin-binding protein H-like isoform X12 [Bubalus kerabau]|uniref:myosin-binding protein H-like isoform X12 n=1 Tax=Bubalus carabanensis TaxID=3119969 RepID=UPI00244E5D7C|nr:myosin-binding protein H-like isoform X12 [Bubalus carabanensis]